MAETCIVCLGDLVHQEESLTANGSPLGTISFDPGPRVRKCIPDKQTQKFLELTPNEELIAHLLPCGHNLHNECLKPWVDRANSCPICRANFNMVELSASIGGPKFSEYAVQDKRQVAELDLSMIADDDYTLGEDDGSYDACMVCEEFGTAAELMYCHSCEELCHVFCAGLERMPSRGPWYCYGCVQDPVRIGAASQRRAAGSPAAYRNGRSRVPHRNVARDDGWVGVWQGVWNQLNFDVEFPFEDEEQSENESEAVRREDFSLERRFALAQQLGAGNRFRAAANTIQARRRNSNLGTRSSNRTSHREAPKPKDPESQEELRAWNQFEKAREQLAQIQRQPSPSTTSSSRPGRKRKSASVDSTPADSEYTEPEPERKLKRPRSRLHKTSGESSSAASSSSAPTRRSLTTNHKPPASASSPASTPASEWNVMPGFLRSLLEEVEVNSSSKSDKRGMTQPRRIIIDRACSPPNSPPGLSPAYPKRRSDSKDVQ